MRNNALAKVGLNNEFAAEYSNVMVDRLRDSLCLLNLFGVVFQARSLIKDPLE